MSMIGHAKVIIIFMKKKLLIFEWIESLIIHGDRSLKVRKVIIKRFRRLCMYVFNEL